LAANLRAAFDLRCQRRCVKIVGKRKLGWSQENELDEALSGALREGGNEGGGRTTRQMTVLSFRVNNNHPWKEGGGDATVDDVDVDVDGDNDDDDDGGGKSREPNPR